MAAVEVLSNPDLAHEVARHAVDDARGRAVLACASPAFRDAAGRLMGLNLDVDNGGATIRLARLPPGACRAALAGVDSVRVRPAAGAPGALRANALLLRVLRRAGPQAVAGVRAVRGVVLHGPWLCALAPGVAAVEAAGYWHSAAAGARLPPGAETLDLAQLACPKPAYPCPRLLANVPAVRHVTLRCLAGARLAALPPGLRRLKLVDVPTGGGDGGPLVSLPPGTRLPELSIAFVAPLRLHSSAAATPSPARVALAELAGAAERVCVSAPGRRLVASVPGDPVLAAGGSDAERSAADAVAAALAACGAAEVVLGAEGGWELEVVWADVGGNGNGADEGGGGDGGGGGGEGGGEGESDVGDGSPGAVIRVRVPPAALLRAAMAAGYDADAGDDGRRLVLTRYTHSGRGSGGA